MKVEDIQTLIHLIDESSIDELEYEQNGEKLTLSKNKGSSIQPVAAPAYQMPPQNRGQRQDQTQTESTPQPDQATSGNTATDENIHTIKSPMVGTFYKSPSPEESNYVNTGDKVKPDTVVCIVEAMKLFNEIEADATGEVVEVLAEDGELVEYGQPLFNVRKER